MRVCKLATGGSDVSSLSVQHLHRVQKAPVLCHMGSASKFLSPLTICLAYLAYPKPAVGTGCPLPPQCSQIRQKLEARRAEEEKLAVAQRRAPLTDRQIAELKQELAGHMLVSALAGHMLVG